MLRILRFSLLAMALATSPLVSDDYLLRAILRDGAGRRAARMLQPPPPPGGGSGGGPPGGGGGPPGGGGGGGMSSLAPGAVSSSTCTSSTCTTAGGGNYISRNLTLDSATGVFSGSLTTNVCPNHAAAYHYSGVLDARVPAATARCQTWTLPVSGYVAGTPTAAPLRSAIGFTISGGEHIYGPMDAGFTLGQVTTTNCGSCPAGTDTRFCAALIEKACGTAALKGNTSESMHMLCVPPPPRSHPPLALALIKAPSFTVSPSCSPAHSCTPPQALRLRRARGLPQPRGPRLRVQRRRGGALCPRCAPARRARRVRPV